MEAPAQDVPAALPTGMPASTVPQLPARPFLNPAHPQPSPPQTRSAIPHAARHPSSSGYGEDFRPRWTYCERAHSLNAVDPASPPPGSNERQEEAVLHPARPCSSLRAPAPARPACSPTRIAYLLSQPIARPRPDSPAITFTNKAAAEMRERIEGVGWPARQAHVISTFLSFCVRVLRREAAALGLKSTFTIYDSTDSAKRLLSLIIKELNLTPRSSPPRPGNRISALKNELVSAESYASRGER